MGGGRKRQQARHTWEQSVLESGVARQRRLRDPNEARTRSHSERDNGSARDGEISRHEISRSLTSAE